LSVFGGVVLGRPGRRWRLGWRRSWAFLATSFLGLLDVVSVLGGVGLGRLRLRRSRALSAYWGSSVLGVWGGVGIGLGRRWRLGWCRSWASGAASLLGDIVLGRFSVLGPVFWVSWAASWAFIFFGVKGVFGILGVLGLLGSWSSWASTCASLASWAASVLGIFGVFVLGLGRLWRLCSWSSLVFGVLGVFGLGSLCLGRPRHLGRRLGYCASWASLILCLGRRLWSCIFGILGILVVGRLLSWAPLGVLAVLGVLSNFGCLVSWASLVLGLWTLGLLGRLWPWRLGRLGKRLCFWASLVTWASMSSLAFLLSWVLGVFGVSLGCVWPWAS
jgi:hypothetical protein